MSQRQALRPATKVRSTNFGTNGAPYSGFPSSLSPKTAFARDSNLVSDREPSDMERQMRQKEHEEMTRGKRDVVSDSGISIF